MKTFTTTPRAGRAAIATSNAPALWVLSTGAEASAEIPRQQLASVRRYIAELDAIGVELYGAPIGEETVLNIVEDHEATRGTVTLAILATELREHVAEWRESIAELGL